MGRRGVKKGQKRGKYAKSTETTRSRIVDAGDDWSLVARANGVKQSTAYNWVSRGSSTLQKKGGAIPNRVKIGIQQEEALVLWLNENPLLTLRELVEKLKQRFDIVVSKQTVAAHLHGRMISLKSVHFQPEAANNLQNKALRKAYIEQLMKATSENKTIVYIDESNVNLFLRRKQGRSRMGQRAVAKLPSCKGANVHMISGLTQSGLVGFERRRGSYKGADCKQWVKKLLDDLIEGGTASNDIAVVIDNAPGHSKLEEVIKDYDGCQLIRLAPYSPMLNPIESAWSVIKSHLAQQEAAQLSELPAGHNNGLTQTEARLQFVERLIDEGRSKVTARMCCQFINHTHKFFADALALKDITAGQ